MIRCKLTLDGAAKYAEKEVVSKGKKAKKVLSACRLLRKPVWAGQNVV